MPGADYRFRVDHTGSYVRSSIAVEVLASSRLLIQTGTTFAPTSGFELTVRNRIPAGSTTIYNEIILSNPFTTAFTYSTTGSWISPLEVTMDMTTAGIRVTNCDIVQFYMGGLDLQLAGASIFTMGATSVTASGVNFDLRNCMPIIKSNFLRNPSTPYSLETANCTLTARADSVSLTTVGGWKINTGSGLEARSVLLDASQTIPTPPPHTVCGACNSNCDTTPYSITVVDNSWAIRINSYDYYDHSYSDTSTQVCYCTSGTATCGIPASYLCRLLTLREEDKYTEVSIAPTDAGIVNYIQEAGAKCWCRGVDPSTVGVISGPTTVSSALTYMGFYQGADKFYGTVGCCTIQTVGACCFGGTPPPDQCDYGLANWCATRVYRQVTWGPQDCRTCTSVGGGDIVSHINGDTYLAYVCDGTVYVKHRPTPIAPWISDNSAGVGIQPSLTIDPHNILYLAYNNNTAPVEKMSFDDGRSFTTETTMGIALGIFPRVCAFSNGDIMRAALINGTGTPAFGTIKGTFQAGGDTAASASFNLQDSGGTALFVANSTAFDICPAHNQQNAMLGAFSIYGETATSDWYSTDDGRTWTRIT